MKIIELTIEDLFSEESGVDAVAFVESPAIETKFIYFNSEEFESYNDYPQSARDNACRAIKWAEENGWGSCGTNVGKIRANQLCNGENITEETISRMASFERHRRNSETPYGEGCGKLMWDAWGGDEGIAWAQRKLSQIREEMAEVGERGGIKESPKAPKSDTPNPNPKGEGSAKGDAGTTRGAKVDKQTEESLQKKSDDFNERYKDKLGYGVNVGMLKSVYQRGLGAYNVSHSPNVSSAKQWAMARVNAFLYIVKNGRPENKKYVSDNDLLPEKHPKKSDKTEMEIDVSNLPTYVQYPTGQTENDMLIEYFSKCGITEEQFKMEFANASEIPWGEGDILPRNESQGRTFYKYMGPNPERDFCRQLMGLNRLYTYDEIKQSNSLSVNAGFGPNGSNTYDIWFYKGGPNCKHYWQKVYATLRNQESKGPARGRAGTPMFDQPNRGYLEPRNFNEQKFVERLPGEKKDDYLQRCVPVLINEGYPQDQAVAICISDFKNFKTMELTIFGYTTKYFYLCAIAQQLFRKLISEENTRDEVVMIRIGAVILDQLFQIESKEVVTEEDYQNAVKLANDFYEIFEQVQILKGEEYDLTFVENHLDIISEKLKKKFNKLKFVNEEKRLVVSPLMIPNILIPRMNELTNEKYYVKFSPDTIEQIQRKYNLEGKMRNTNIEHESDNSMKDAVLVENWLVENEKDKIYNYFTKEDVPFGSWVGVYYILETEEGNFLWKKIKSGEVKGLSVEGNFILN
jgi:hypothetical protein